MHLRKVTITVTLGEKNHGSHMTGKELGARKGNPGGQRHAVTSKRSQDWNPTSALTSCRAWGNKPAFPTVPFLVSKMALVTTSFSGPDSRTSALFIKMVHATRVASPPPSPRHPTFQISTSHQHHRQSCILRCFEQKCLILLY